MKWGKRGRWGKARNEIVERRRQEAGGRGE
jgi:hypothetical protein